MTETGLEGQSRLHGERAVEVRVAPWPGQLAVLRMLADHIARRFEGRGEPREDLAQVARVGLVNAVTRFDVHAGSDFVWFAVPTIMGAVRRHFRDNSWAVKVPRRLKELHLQLGAATARLSQRLGRAPMSTTVEI
jgi:RNA polymerase sigma-B factor